MANVIGDIAGRYKTLQALLDKMPDDEPVSVGDMIDRGPASKEVLDFFMTNGRAVIGNHEHMMVDAYRNFGYYERGIWQWNGGNTTLRSFEVDSPFNIPKEYIEWVESLPFYLEIDNCLITHAFVPPGMNLKEACDLGKDYTDADRTIIWNRSYPERIDGYSRQIIGHNSHMGYVTFGDEKGSFATCLDSSRQEVLTGINTKTFKVYQHEYID